MPRALEAGGADTPKKKKITGGERSEGHSPSVNSHRRLIGRHSGEGPSGGWKMME